MSGNDTQPQDGMGHAYRYWDLDSQSYKLHHSSIFATAYDPQSIRVWAVYKDGFIDHAATKSEWQDELYLRLFDRMAEGLADDKYNEFVKVMDSGDDDEAIGWLMANRPDFPDVLAAVAKEMDEAEIVG